MAALKTPLVHTMAQQISPNLLSSDLFHPGWVKKQNAFTTGVTSRKANFWGNDSSRYGGTGKLPALKTSHDFDKNSRSHRHYCSGIHSFDGPPQPCVITTITPIIHHTYELCSKQLLPDHLVPNPYANHISRFEVFPRFDPGRTQYDVPSKRTLQQEIGPATQIALEELSDSIYRETEYQKNFKPAMSVENTSIVTLPEIEHLVQLNDNENKDKDDEYVKEIKEKQEPEDEEEEDEESSIKPGSDSNSAETIVGKTIPIIDTKSTCGNPTVQKAFNSDSLTKKAKPSLCRLEKLSVNNQSFGLPSDYRARQKLSLLLPKVTYYGKKKTYTTPKLITLPRMPGAYRSCINGDIRLPSIGFIHSDALHHRKQLSLIKQRLPEMVGMKFKSDAHVKYHRNHPESIPDYRESITNGKQHFFYGVHASLLR